MPAIYFLDSDKNGTYVGFYMAFLGADHIISIQAQWKTCDNEGCGKAGITGFIWQTRERV